MQRARGFRVLPQRGSRGEEDAEAQNLLNEFSDDEDDDEEMLSL